MSGPNRGVQRTATRASLRASAADADSFGVKSSWFAAMKLGRVSLGRGRRPPVHRPDGVGELGKAFDSGVATQQRVSAHSFVTLEPWAEERQTPNPRLQRTSARGFAAALAAEAHSFGSRMTGCFSLVMLVAARVSAASGDGAHGAFQEQASFAAAVRNGSTAPSYVLITVVDDRTGATRTGCQTANALLGAIHTEYGLDYDDNGMAKGIAIALANGSHEFHLSKKAALDNISFFYSNHDLETVRKALSGLTDQQLRAGFSGGGALRSSYDRRSWKRHRALRDATACVLIEHGLSVGMGDVSDDIWIAP